MQKPLALVLFVNCIVHFLTNYLNNWSSLHSSVLQDLSWGLVDKLNNSELMTSVLNVSSSLNLNKYLTRFTFNFAEAGSWKIDFSRQNCIVVN